jgi:hypothetical protein
MSCMETLAQITLSFIKDWDQIIAENANIITCNQACQTHRNQCETNVESDEAVKDRGTPVHTISRRGSMTDSEGLWPQLVCCAPHLSTVPLISDKVQ